MNSKYFGYTASLLSLLYITFLFSKGIKAHSANKNSSLEAVIIYIAITALPLVIPILAGLLINQHWIAAAARLLVLSVTFGFTFQMYGSIVEEISSDSFKYSGATVIVFLAMISGAALVMLEAFVYGINLMAKK